MTRFTDLPDLAVRDLGGSVMAASDELFAEKENLLKPEPAVAMDALGHKGGLFDGWETRRRRRGGDADWAIVRLGAPGVVRGVVVDTAHFTGNAPAEITVEGTGVEGHPDPEALEDAEWVTLVPRTGCEPDSANPFLVTDERRFTHVRLLIHPDGGVARFRVHGEAVPDPRVLADSPIDLVALENGGRMISCSDRFYSSPERMLIPGPPRGMDGWETRRRRDDGNDWVEFELATQAEIRLIELDTTYNVGNAPGAAQLRGRDSEGTWVEVLPTTPAQPDTRHRFRVAGAPATAVRLDIYPDGGVARLRLFGRPTEQGMAALAANWFDRLPASQGAVVLSDPADRALLSRWISLPAG